MALDTGMNNTSPLFWANRTLGLHLSGDLGILGVIKNYSLDPVVLPTYFATLPSAMVGSPAVTVPMGVYPLGTPVTRNGYGDLVHIWPGVPIGISFLGDRFSEEALIGMAYAFEQRTKVRGTIKPYMQPATELWHVVGRDSLVDDEQDLNIPSHDGGHETLPGRCGCSLAKKGYETIDTRSPIGPNQFVMFEVIFIAWMIPYHV